MIDPERFPRTTKFFDILEKAIPIINPHVEAIDIALMIIIVISLVLKVLCVI